MLGESTKSSAMWADMNRLFSPLSFVFPFRAWSRNADSLEDRPSVCGLGFYNLLTAEKIESRFRKRIQVQWGTIFDCLITNNFISVKAAWIFYMMCFHMLAIHCATNFSICLLMCNNQETTTTFLSQISPYPGYFGKMIAL